MILRHHEDIGRLLAGTESKFHFSSKKHEKPADRAFLSAGFF